MEYVWKQLNASKETANFEINNQHHSCKEKKNFVDKNNENNYSKILTPDNIDFEMSARKMKESINNPLEAFDIENETLKK